VWRRACDYREQLTISVKDLWESRDVRRDCTRRFLKSWTHSRAGTPPLRIERAKKLLAETTQKIETPPHCAVIKARKLLRRFQQTTGVAKTFRDSGCVSRDTMCRPSRCWWLGENLRRQFERCETTASSVRRSVRSRGHLLRLKPGSMPDAKESRMLANFVNAVCRSINHSVRSGLAWRKCESEAGLRRR